jgi:membrane fusion protein (multidrug efflux system)
MARFTAACGAALGLAIALAGCGRDAPGGQAPQGPRPPAVEVVTLAAEPFRETAALLGELQARETVLVKPEVSGVVEGVQFEEGEAVAAGAVLFQLRDREEQARLREAQAQFALAQDTFDRTARLANRNAAAEAQLERARSQLEVARARADRRRVELERTRVRAPFDGMVGARLVSPGARVTQDDALVRIDAIDPVQLVFTIPEWALPQARVGASFELSVAAYPTRSFPGEIHFIAPSVDSATRRVLIKGRVPNPERLLLPGMFAQVTAQLGQRDALLLPEEAVVNDSGGAFVWRIATGGEAERVGVQLGARQGGRVEVRSGLRAGDRIVTAGTHKVRAGQKVEAVAPGGAAPAAPPPLAKSGGGDA